MTLRVVHFGTGFAGVHALRGIIEHPELELVGLVVHSDEKAGRDAGELAGLEPVGVLATQDIDPGFFSDFVPVILSGCSRRIDSIRIYEIALYESGHQSDEVAFDIRAFGQPMDVQPPMVDPAGLNQWRGVIELIAQQLDVALDDVATSYELLAAERGFDYQGRRIEAGTIAGFRFEIAGTVDGVTRIAVEHVTRTQEDQAPDWQRGLDGDAYRVVVDGSPRLDCEFNFRDGDDHLAGGFNITAMRAVNAIPALCRAAPGVVSTFDLEPVTGRGRFARATG